MFNDSRRIERFDNDHSWNEDRWVGIGMAYPHILFVVYAIKEHDKYRLISARKANAREEREDRGL
ncbi:MAG: BrnT family toxin [Desulfovibrio sp.]|nr:BrnT family toxin [Desulfovibrio sp.]